MRLLVLSVGVLSIACLGATCATRAMAQTDQWGQAEDQIPPYRTHVDMRHGHNRVYPDRGAILREVPRGATGVNYAGISYRFAGGVWFEQIGPAYIVVAPPIGLIVPNLPGFATSFNSSGKTYLYADDVFYRPRPDLGGYEVVNDPQDAELKRTRGPIGASALRLASATATADFAVARASVRSHRRRAPSARPVVARASDSPVSASTPVAAAQKLALAAPAPTAMAAPAPTPAVMAARAPPEPAPAESVPAPPPIAAPAMAAPTVASPTMVAQAPANPTGVAISPLQGQGADQQAMDRYECYRFAVARTGFDPLAGNSGTASEAITRLRGVYSRAQAECLESRGYSVP